MGHTRAKILVIEDNDDARALMTMFLASEGYDVRGAASALEGLRCLEADVYDLVLTDYHMPDHSGMWMIREAQQRRLLGRTRTVLVTADSEAAEIGNQPVVRKPVDFRSFLPQLHAMLNGGGAGDALDDAGTVEGGRPGHAPRIELVLYISGDSVPCHRAATAMRRILADYRADEVAFSVRDVADDLAAAERDRVIFTPTLVKRWPLPPVWVVGDLAQPQVVTDLLEIAGVAPLV